MLSHQKFIFFIIIFFMITSPVYAYVDPGTGSFYFQFFLAALFAGFYLVKTQLQRMISFFIRIKGFFAKR